MDIIRKQISLDSCRSHRKGLLPFVDDNGIVIDVTEKDNFNYGGFVFDLEYEKCNNNNECEKISIKYLDIISCYNYIIDKLRSGIYGYGSDVNNEFIVELCNDSYNCVNEKEYKCEDKNLLDFIPLDINDFIQITDNSYKNIKKLDEGYYVLIEDYKNVIDRTIYISQKIFNKTYKDGLTAYKDFINFVFYLTQKDNDDNHKLVINKNNDQKIILSYNSYSFYLVKPYVEIPILLEEESIFNNINYTYENTYGGKNGPIFVNGENYNGITNGDIIYDLTDSEFNFYIEENSVKSGLKKEFINVNIEVESKLSSLFHESSIEIDEDIFGIPDVSEVDLQFYKCHFNNGIWDGKSIAITNTNGFLCKNGETLRPNSNEYHSITFLNCLYDNRNGYYGNGDYYFSVRYNKNDSSHPIRIPFKEGELLNINDNTCDFISAITYNENSVEITYVIGAEINNKYKTGIVYKEKLDYRLKSKITNVDGYEIELYYEDINYDSNIQSIYNKDLDTYCDVRMATITAMTICDVWQNGIAVNLPLFTKENSESLYSNPKMNINMTFNRGNAAGWEKHFKLSECNTMKDLENYGNNFFNI